MAQPAKVKVKFRFYGSKERGYTAEHFSTLRSVHVQKNADGRWAAWFYGNPRTRNPVETDFRGNTFRSCTCPKVHVDQTFPTRQAAAEGGLFQWALDYPGYPDSNAVLELFVAPCSAT